MRVLTCSEAINEALRVFILGEDVGVMGGVFGITAGLLAQFGEARVIDTYTPISGAGIVDAALDTAMMGMRPVVEIMFGDFLGCAGDQVINQDSKARYMSGGKARVPLTIRVTTGAPATPADAAQKRHSRRRPPCCSSSTMLPKAKRQTGISPSPSDKPTWRARTSR